jgi:hypothetical protein
MYSKRHSFSLLETFENLIFTQTGFQIITKVLIQEALLSVRFPGYHCYDYGILFQTINYFM